MMTRRAIATGMVTVLTLAGCEERRADPAPIAAAEAEAAAAQEDDGRILCAAGAGEALTRQCTVERTEGAEGLVLVVRRPDGGFHRLLVTRDGRGVVAADGAEAARVAVVGDDRIEVTIGGARYQLPATVR